MCMCSAVLPLHPLAASRRHRYCGGALYCGACASGLEWKGKHVRGVYNSINVTLISGIPSRDIQDSA
jgi:hypothetical protein